MAADAAKLRSDLERAIHLLAFPGTRGSEEWKRRGGAIPGFRR